MKQLKRFMLLLHQYHPSIIPIMLLTSLVKALTPFISLFISAMLLDRLLIQDFAAAAWLAGLLIFLSFVLGILYDLLSMKQADYSSQLFLFSTTSLYDKALHLDYASISSHQTQRDVQVAINTISHGGGFAALLNLFGQVVENLITILTSCSLVLYLCLQPPGNQVFPRLASSPVSLGITLLVLGMLIFFNFQYRKNDQKIRSDHFSRCLHSDMVFMYIHNRLFNDPQAFKTIQIYHMTPMLTQRLTADQQEATKIFTAIYPQNQKINCLESLFSGMIMLLSYGLVVIKIMAGAISVGGLLKYAGAISQFSAGFLQLIGNRAQLMVYLSNMSYVLDFLDQENQYETGHIPVEKRLDNVYELEFHDVSFAYPGTDEPVLSHVSCQINLKQKMAVVGPNGAGKTTFIKLLCRLYDPTSGYITLNGVDIRKYEYSDYLNLFGVVFQDFALFPYSLAENIAASQNPDPDRVWKVLSLVELDQRIRQLPSGIDTPVFSHGEEGVNFSGGEQQKIAIARALYKDAPLVILDEPTAALDPISEFEIYSHFDTLVQDKTSVFISHRMSSCRFCQDILVFDEGQLKERGSHDALLAQEGSLYTSLWQAQAQYYQQD